MYELDAYKDNDRMPSAKIRQLKTKRDWMHEVTYNCTPVTLMNTLGYGIYFEEDISFSWDGDRKNPAEANIGKHLVWSGRGEGTVSFNTNLIFKTDKDVSMLTLPVPNQFIEGAEVISTILSTSLFTGAFPIVWKLHHPNKEYFVPAGTNIACLLPISVAQFQNSNINIIDKVFDPSKRIQDKPEYLKKIQEYVEQGKRIRMYKKAINENGEKIGEHEVENLTMSVTYKND